MIKYQNNGFGSGSGQEYISTLPYIKREVESYMPTLYWYELNLKNTSFFSKVMLIKIINFWLMIFSRFFFRNTLRTLFTKISLLNWIQTSLLSVLINYRDFHNLLLTCLIFCGLPVLFSFKTVSLVTNLF